MGEYHEAIEIYLKVKSLYASERDKAALGITCAKLALVYHKVGENEKAAKETKNALKSAQESNSPGVIDSLNSLLPQNK